MEWRRKGLNNRSSSIKKGYGFDICIRIASAACILGTLYLLTVGPESCFYKFHEKDKRKLPRSLICLGCAFHRLSMKTLCDRCLLTYCTCSEKKELEEYYGNTAEIKCGSSFRPSLEANETDDCSSSDNGNFLIQNLANSVNLSSSAELAKRSSDSEACMIHSRCCYCNSPLTPTDAATYRSVKRKFARILCQEDCNGEYYIQGSSGPERSMSGIQDECSKCSKVDWYKVPSLKKSPKKQKEEDDSTIVHNDEDFDLRGIMNGDKAGKQQVCIENGSDEIAKLQEALAAERAAIDALYVELEEERNAAAVAANETLAMITRLQEEKAAVQMEATHYTRMVEEKAEYDQEAITMLKDFLARIEEEKCALEREVELYRSRFLGRRRRYMPLGTEAYCLENSDSRTFVHEEESCWDSDEFRTPYTCMAESEVTMDQRYLSESRPNPSREGRNLADSFFSTPEGFRTESFDESSGVLMQDCQIKGSAKVYAKSQAESCGFGLWQDMPAFGSKEGNDETLKKFKKPGSHGDRTPVPMYNVLSPIPSRDSFPSMKSRQWERASGECYESLNGSVRASLPTETASPPYWEETAGSQEHVVYEVQPEANGASCESEFLERFGSSLRRSQSSSQASGPGNRSRDFCGSRSLEEILDETWYTSLAEKDLSTGANGRMQPSTGSTGLADRLGKPETRQSMDIDSAKNMHVTHFADIRQSNEDDKSSVEEQLKQLNGRLQSLEGDRELMRRTLSSLKRESGEMKLLQDIAHELRQIRGVESARVDTRDLMPHEGASFTFSFKGFLSFNGLRRNLHSQLNKLACLFLKHPDAAGLTYGDPVGLSYLLENSQKPQALTRSMRSDLPHLLRGQRDSLSQDPLLSHQSMDWSMDARGRSETAFNGWDY